MELVSSEKRLQKLINKATFKHCTSYNDNLNAAELENKIIKFDKPIYVGFAVLDISKTLMYDYHFNVMKKHYGDNIKLMNTDTDSLVYHINTKDFYGNLTNNPNLLDRMDTSDLPKDHPCHIAEQPNHTHSFWQERRKSRSLGIRQDVVKNHMTYNDQKVFVWCRGDGFQ
ncbi:Uncharacterized protein FWK35_00017047 [Aphis craccivora]|uniref:Uncharacterized protein n=1 Tax=Aphis craccivora TaxID=307492 RepID=A0A6G0X6M0_APHCR|nr:Uncharacterized protein FWK35_00017047 [Aphis craccivora]